jgi:hypothetical protein
MKKNGELTLFIPLANRLPVAVAALITCLIGSAATADLIHVTRTPAADAPIPPRNQPVTGYGDNIPLHIAVKMIAPPQVSVEFSGLNPDTTVSYEGGEGWYTTLETVISDAGGQLSGTLPDLTAHKRQPTPAPRLQRVASTPVSGSELPTLGRQSEPSAPGAQTGQRIFVQAKEGETLQRTLSQVLEPMGWTLVYTTRFQYRNAASASFEANSVEQAVRTLAAAYDSDPPIRVDVYANRVVRVTTPTE